MMKPCERCGNEFYARPSSADRRKFCSRACQFPNAGEEYVAKKECPGLRRNIIGQVFNGVEALRLSDRRDRKGQLKYFFRCHCGNEFETVGYYVTSNKTKSCGCLHGKNVGKVTHGHTIRRDIPVEYNTWIMMRDRCQNERSKCYHNYGGRGIYVCPRWDNSFEAFFEDMGRRPTKKSSIDRIDNNGPYACGKCDDCIARGHAFNCRWATQKEQSRNTRVNRIVEHEGESKTLVEWSEDTGIDGGTIHARLKSGWSVNKALTEPVKPKPKEKKVRVRLTPEQLRESRIAARRAQFGSRGGKRLSPDDVREIKKRLRAGEMKSRIAEAFNVTPTTISYIANGKQWSYVE